MAGSVAVGSQYTLVTHNLKPRAREANGAKSTPKTSPDDPKDHIRPSRTCRDFQPGEEHVPQAPSQKTATRFKSIYDCVAKVTAWATGDVIELTGAWSGWWRHLLGRQRSVAEEQLGTSFRVGFWNPQLINPLGNNSSLLLRNSCQTLFECSCLIYV